MRSPSLHRSFHQRMFIATILAVVLSAPVAKAQFGGGTASGQETPQEVKPHELSPSVLQGDVDLFTGRYSASHPLGSVSTPGGLSYALELNYSPSFTSGPAEPYLEGVPYGEGWSLNVPMIHVTTMYHTSDLDNPNGQGSDCEDHWTYNGVYDKMDEGRGVWTSAWLSIPGVASGRLVLKEVMNDHAVFMLNAFEQYVEARFRSGHWEVRTRDGKHYEFGGATTVRLPDSRRRIDYGQLNDYLTSCAHEGPEAKIAKSILPRQHTTTWYCSTISDPLHLPLQNIRFTYEHLGEFDFYKELQQSAFGLALDIEFHGGGTVNGADGSVWVTPNDPLLLLPSAATYQVMQLKRVTASAAAGYEEYLDLIYDTDALLPGQSVSHSLLNNGGEPHDELYYRKTIYHQGLADGGQTQDDFTGWHRIMHPMVVNGGPDCKIPTMHDAFLATNGYRYREGVPDAATIPFAHSVLQSPVIDATEQELRPGDIIEIRTRMAGSGTMPGNLDIQVFATPDDEPPFPYDADLVQYDPHPVEQHEKTLFSTFDRAVKWNTKGDGENVRTSNFFVLPDLDRAFNEPYGHIRIRIGPGNSDNDYGMAQGDIWINNANNIKVPSAYKSYAHWRWKNEPDGCGSGPNPLNYIGSPEKGLMSHHPMPHQFGIGMPWSMMLKAHRHLGFGVFNTVIDPNGPSCALDPLTSDMFNFWWRNVECPHDGIPTIDLTWDNTPTLLGSTTLQEVEVVRYAKVPRMLKSVERRLVNGQAADADGSLAKLVGAFDLAYAVTNAHMVSKAQMQLNDPVVLSAKNRQAIVLASVTARPVDPTDDPDQDPLTVPEAEWPRTRFTYEKIVDLQVPDNTIPNFDCQYDPDPNDGVPCDPYIPFVDHMLHGGYWLSKVTDPLGRETSIVYNDPRVPALREVTYHGGPIPPWQILLDPCGNWYYRSPDFTLTPTVKELRISSGAGSQERVRSFSYANKIWRSKASIVAGPPWKAMSNGPNGLEYGYRQVTVLGPELYTNGPRQRTEHEFRGRSFVDVETITHDCYPNGWSITVDYPGQADPQIIADFPEDYLLFGKLIRSERFDAQDRTIALSQTEYDAVLAYENASLRPHGNRWSLGTTSAYLDHMPGFTAPSSTSSTAMGRLDAASLDHDAKPWETPRYYEIDVAEDAVPTNPAAPVLLNSHFVRKVRELNSELDPEGERRSCLQPVAPDTWYEAPGPSTNPGGTGYTNTAINGNATTLSNALSNTTLTGSVKSDLIANTPLTESVLDAAITHATGAQAQALAEVLLAQPGLSNARTVQYLARAAAATNEPWAAVLRAQSYLSDTILLDLLGRASLPIGTRADLLMAQAQLSTAVIDSILRPALPLGPGHTVAVLKTQNTLTADQLLAILGHDSIPDQLRAEILLAQPGLTEAVLQEAIDQAYTMDLEALRRLLVHSPNGPDAAQLTQLLQKQPPLPLELLRDVILAYDDTLTGTHKSLILQHSGLEALLPPDDPWATILGYCKNVCSPAPLTITTITDFSYYDADETGLTSAEGYKRLMGLEHVGSFRLKHDPSWLLYSTKTWSPHYPGAYQQKEYFYYQDLLNRYDRWPEVWALEEDDPMNPPGFQPRIFVDDNDHTLVHGVQLFTVLDGQDPYEVPPIEAIARLTEFGDRTDRVFQVRTSVQAADGRPPVAHSEFQYHFGRWNQSRYDVQQREWAVIDEEDYVTHVMTTTEDCPPDWTYSVAGTPGGGGPDDPPAPDVETIYTLIGVDDDNWTDHTQEVPAGYVMVRDTHGRYYAMPQTAWETEPEGFTRVHSTPAGGGRFLVHAILYAKAFQLRKQAVQADEHVLEGFKPSGTQGDRLFYESPPLMQFDVVTHDPNDPEHLDGSTGFVAELAPAIPYPHIVQRTVVERNPFAQVALERNERELFTRYHYNRKVRHWYDFGLPYICHNFSTWELDDPGLPTAITVGEGRADALTTSYDFHQDLSVAGITDPNGMLMEHRYDVLGRLWETRRNGELLQRHRYHQWSNVSANDADDELDRTRANYTEVMQRIEEGSTAAMQQRSHVDPLGRALVTIDRPVSDLDNPPATTTAMVVSGRPEYDAWDRVVHQHEPREHTLGGQGFPFALDQSVLDAFGTADAKHSTLYEDDHRGRPLFQSAPGLDINGPHRTSTRYALMDCPSFACALGLGAGELALLAPDNPMQTRWRMTEVTDPDGLRTRSYTNALGQQVATQAWSSAGTAVVTLFLYDGAGRLEHVIDPEKRWSSTGYNLLGWPTWRKTPDAGHTRTMYDVSGNVVLEQSAEGRHGEVALDVNAYTPVQLDDVPWYRRYTYDAYGRITAQDRVRLALHSPGDNTGAPLPDGSTLLSQPVDALLYTPARIGAHPVSDEPADPNDAEDFAIYHYSTASTIDRFARMTVWRKTSGTPVNHEATVVPISDLLCDPVHEKAWSYGTTAPLTDPLTLYPDQQQLLNGRGWLAGRMSANLSWGHLSFFYLYDDQGGGVPQRPVLAEYLAYDPFGQVHWQLRQFNPNGISEQARGLISTLEHPERDLRGLDRTLNIDVNVDGQIDLQVHRTYDARGRLKDLHAGHVDQGTANNLLFRHTYDPARGLLTRRTHHHPCAGLTDPVVDQVDLSYDLRRRLTTISGTYYSEQLLYDDEQPLVNGLPLPAGQHWNGAINGLVHSWVLSPFTNHVPGLMDLPTTFGFTYDGLGRLVNAEGHLADNWSFDDDARYAYDRIGNITQLLRSGHITPGTSTPQLISWAYQYPLAANRLLAVQAAPQSHLPTRSYTYDANGNLLTDSHRYLQETTYGRANLPFQLVQNDPDPGRTLSTYLYDANDQRIYARSGAEPDVDRCTYTLRDVDGSEVGVLDLARPWEEPPAEGDPGTCPEGWSWYLFGAHRLARITPACDQQPALYTADLGRAAFAQGSEPYDLLLGFLQLQLAQPGGIQWPLLLRIVHLTDSTDLYLGDAHYEQLTAQDTALAALPVTRVQFEHEREWVVLTAPDKRQVEFSLEEMLGTAQQRSSGGVPFAYTAPAHTALNQVTYYDHDHLGNTRLTYTPTRCQDLAPTDGVPEWALNIEHAVDYDPYGKILREYVNGSSERYLTTHHERDAETGLDYRGARYYDSDVARFLSVDAFADLAPAWTPYRYAFNNPISILDPTGNYESTHTDEDGNIIAVYDDGDNGVYAHANGTTKDEINQKRAGTCDPAGPTTPSTSGGGTLMGTTEHWDEFISPETGKAMTSTRIQFGATWDNIVDKMVYKAQAGGMDLMDIARESRPGGTFDIKKDYPGVGAMLNGKYATSRSAGNYLAGRNAAVGTLFGAGVSFDTFQKLAGALHVKGSLTTSQKVDIVVNGTSYGPAPAYGEVMYQYRMSKAGWESYRPSK